MISAIALIVFAVLCLFALWRPHWAGVLALSFIGYEQLLSSFYAQLARNSWLLNVVSGSVVLLATLTALIMGQKPLRGYFNVNTVLVWSLYALAIFGVTYSLMPAAGIYFIKKGMPPAVLMLALFPMIILSWETLKRMSIPLMIFGSILIVLIIISPRTQIYGSRLFIDLSYTGGTGSKRGNPLSIAEVGGYTMIFAALYEPNRRNIIITILRLGAFLLGATIAFLVGSRGQLVFAMFFSVLLYPLAHQVRDIKQFFLRAGSGGFALGTIFVVGKFLASRSESSRRFTASDISEGLEGRLYFATELLGEYSINPGNYLQGLGTGSFNAVVKHDGEGFLYPHNIIVEVLAHHGLVGLTILLGIFLITGAQMLKTIKLALNGTIDRSAAAILLALVCYTTLLAMKQGSFVLIPLPFFTYLLLSKLLQNTQEISEPIYDLNQELNLEPDHEYQDD